MGAILFAWLCYDHDQIFLFYSLLLASRSYVSPNCTIIIAHLYLRMEIYKKNSLILFKRVLTTLRDSITACQLESINLTSEQRRERCFGDYCEGVARPERLIYQHRDSRNYLL